MSDEAHVSALKSRPQAPARIPRPHGDEVGPADHRTAAGEGSQAPDRVTLERLRKRRDFLAANRGARAACDGFVLLMNPRGDGDPQVRVGFTVTKKIGGAVVRNRLKRRLRAAARTVLPASAPAGVDIVLIGRKDAVVMDFARIERDLAGALRRARAKLA